MAGLTGPVGPHTPRASASLGPLSGIALDTGIPFDYLQKNKPPPAFGGPPMESLSRGIEPLRRKASTNSLTKGNLPPENTRLNQSKASPSLPCMRASNNPVRQGRATQFRRHLITVQHPSFTMPSGRMLSFWDLPTVEASRTPNNSRRSPKRPIKVKTIYFSRCHSKTDMDKRNYGNEGSVFRMPLPMGRLRRCQV